jgi:fatty-acyl-CoA synthase
MTETSAGGTLTQASDVEHSEKFAYESIGRPFPFVEAKIINPDTGDMVPRNVDGEICLRGFNIMREYWDEIEKTNKVKDRNGWFRTGDIACMDEEGYLYYKCNNNNNNNNNRFHPYCYNVKMFYLM